MSEPAGIDETLQIVRDRLAQMQGDLDVLSGAIWRSIDHDSADELETGVRFKQRFNQKRESLEQAMDEMLALLRDYPSSGPGRGAGPAEPTAGPTEPKAGQKGLETTPPAEIEVVPLSEDLDQKVPFGFVLTGQTFTSASAWPLFYEALLQELYGRGAESLVRLVGESGSFSYQGKPLFARVPDALDDPLPIADAIFAEADLEPRILLSVIKHLIGELGYPLESFKILLREKNRGTVETLSIAA